MHRRRRLGASRFTRSRLTGCLSRFAHPGTSLPRSASFGLAWRDAQAEDDPSKDPYSQPNRRKTLGIDQLPTNQGVFVGSYASVARMLDDMATVPGVRGVMLTFDDFIIGMEQFGTRILPLMHCRKGLRQAA